MSNDTPPKPSAEIIEWDGVTSLDIPVERVLSRALRANLDSVVIVGWREDGSFYFCSSKADAADCAWALQRGVYELNRIVDDD